MRRSTLDILACPACRSDQGFALDVHEETADGDILTGRLTCSGCGAVFSITNAIPRFVAADEDYCGNFGFQWREWKSIQIDRLAGHTLSETRFLKDSRWTPDWIDGKLILDSGCGAGRFTDVVAGKGGRVIAVDISDAIDICREITAVHGDRVECIQASLLQLPLRRGVFDGIFCMGVIQHTPAPDKVMKALPVHLKPGGRLVYNFYEEGLWRRLQVIKYALRLITPRLPIEKTLGLCRTLVRGLFPLTVALAKIPKIRILNHFIPICATHFPELTREQQYAWTVLDTFDWYAPQYELRQHHRAVEELVKDVGLVDVDSEPGLVRGHKPYR